METNPEEMRQQTGNHNATFLQAKVHAVLSCQEGLKLFERSPLNSHHQVAFLAGPGVGEEILISQYQDSSPLMQLVPGVADRADGTPVPLEAARSHGVRWQLGVEVVAFGECVWQPLIPRVSVKFDLGGLKVNPCCPLRLLREVQVKIREVIRVALEGGDLCDGVVIGGGSAVAVATPPARC